MCMDREESTETESTDVVNYMPGMPRLPREPGRIGRFVRSLLRRRGGLRPVVSNARNASGRRDGQ